MRSWFLSLRPSVATAAIWSRIRKIATVTLFPRNDKNYDLTVFFSITYFNRVNGRSTDLKMWFGNVKVERDFEFVISHNVKDLLTVSVE